jgi:hypothetical protein
MSTVSEDAEPMNAAMGIEIVRPLPRTKSISIFDVFEAQGMRSVEF